MAARQQLEVPRIPVGRRIGEPPAPRVLVVRSRLRAGLRHLASAASRSCLVRRSFAAFSSAGAIEVLGGCPRPRPGTFARLRLRNRSRSRSLRFRRSACVSCSTGGGTDNGERMPSPGTTTSCKRCRAARTSATSTKWTSWLPASRFLFGNWRIQTAPSAQEPPNGRRSARSCWHVSAFSRPPSSRRPAGRFAGAESPRHTRVGREGQMRRTCDPRDASPSQACVDLRSAVGMIAGHIFVGLASSPSGVVSKSRKMGAALFGAFPPPQTPSQARHKHNTRKRGEPSIESGPSSTILAHRVSAQGTHSPVDLQQGANRRRIS